MPYTATVRNDSAVPTPLNFWPLLQITCSIVVAFSVQSSCNYGIPLTHPVK